MNDYPVELTQNVVIGGNNNVVDGLVQNNFTVYGSIASSIEKKRPEIDQAIEQIAGYFAANKAIEITKNYEESRSFREKWIKNDSVKQKQMELEREFTTECTSAGVQLVLKGGVWIAEKTMTYLENNERKKSLWSLFFNFANYLVKEDISSNPCLMAKMSGIYAQMFKKNKVIDLTVSGLSDRRWIPSNDVEAKNVAQLLYEIYSVALYHSSNAQTKERCLEKLIEYWIYLGIECRYQETLLKNFELLDKGNAIEFTRFNKTLQLLYNNLSISNPSIDRKVARMINSELLKYVPNGDKQLAVRKGASVFSKAAVSAAAGVFGVNLSNPILLNTAATSAVSLLDDLSKTELIGNCLTDSGIDEKFVKGLLNDATKLQKKRKSV